MSLTVISILVKFKTNQTRVIRNLQFLVQSQSLVLHKIAQCCVYIFACFDEPIVFEYVRGSMLFERKNCEYVQSTSFWQLDLFCRMPLARDFLHPSPIEEKRKHKLKRLVQKPNSYFMDVKCPGCYAIKTIFSHAQRPVECDGCRTILCTPTGGKARLTEGCSFRRKVQC